MKITRLIYKHHLLPPFVIHFDSLTQFFKSMHPQEYEEILPLPQSLKKEKRQKRRKDLNKVNEAISFQLIHFRQKYIRPLRECPTYYQELHKGIVGKLAVTSGLSYRDAQKQINKQFVYYRFQSKYRAFKGSLNQNLFHKVIFLPLCLYHSKESLIFDKFNGASLNIFQQKTEELNFIDYFEAYKRELTRISSEENLSLEELLSLMRSELSPQLPELTKRILFPQ